ncbi:MAG TPA: RNA methyltransferase [Candidatus Dojkabacteria bacterium]|nr:RNA methyltransferase [Candidatus Dojkabacteria bacterium]HOR05917.1 RNA methyltransferase [Candidatus Dojkabacteria bacterium]HQI92741.1 RNA methyltransferase [Candidatus Dojkabacteria bacterium]
MSKTRFIQVESKNAILELLKEGRDFDKLYIAANAFKDEKVREIVEIAGKKNIPVLKVSRKIITRRLRNSNSESILGYMYSQNNWDLEELLDKLSSEGKQPFFLVLDDLKYTQNIAAIMRTAFAVGVNGIIVNPQEKNLITNETIRISMGAAERIPLVETNLFNALKLLTKNNIKIFAVHMDGKVYFETNLKGAVAFVMGAEDVGITAGLLERADEKISIPMREGIGSLNVSASAAVVMYEKLRQEVTA